MTQACLLPSLPTGWGIDHMLLFVAAVFLVAAAVSTMSSVSLLLLMAGISSILLEVILP